MGAQKVLCRGSQCRGCFPAVSRGPPRHLLAGSSAWPLQCGENVGWAVGKKGPFVRVRGWDVSSPLEFFFFFFPSKISFCQNQLSSVQRFGSDGFQQNAPCSWLFPRWDGNLPCPLGQQHPHGLTPLPFPFQSPFHSRATQNPACSWERDAGTHLTPTKEPCCGLGLAPYPRPTWLLVIWVIKADAVQLWGRQFLSPESRRGAAVRGHFSLGGIGLFLLQTVGRTWKLGSLGTEKGAESP